MVRLLPTLFVGLLACSADPAPAKPAPTPTPASVAPASVAPASVAPASAAPASAASASVASKSSAQITPGRVVAIGDLHGDFQATRKVLQLAGLTNEQDAWIGGKTTLVQTGDVLDRGDGEAQIFGLLFDLRDQAQAAGGRVVLMNGNHEVMNIQGDLRYVTPGAAVAFGPDRKAAFAPGSIWAKRLAELPIITQVGDTIFAHGGVLPQHARYGVAKINAEAKAWMRGDAAALPVALRGADSPIWTRLFSSGDVTPHCATLAQTLDLLKAKRLVVGHTVQRGGPTSDCNGQVWRIDVGMSAHYGGAPAALEIVGDQVRILTAP